MRTYIIFIVGILLATVIFFILKVEGIIDYNILSILLIPSGLLPGIFYSWVTKWKEKDQFLQQLLSKNILGVYIREDIGQDNTGDCSVMKTRNVGLEIKVEYSEESQVLEINADYWKSIDGLDLVNAKVNILSLTPFKAEGTYRYVKSFNGNLNHSGKYEIQQINRNKLNVRYWHEFPRELNNNPDSNRGWEIWVKES